MKRHCTFICGLGLLLVLAACGSTAPAAESSTPTSVASAPTATGVPTATIALTATSRSTATRAPTATSVVTATQTAARTSTASATATPVLQATAKPQPAPSAVPPAPAPDTGAVPPDLVQSMIDDLAGRLNIGREAISVQSAEAVTWSDSSLGCPMPGVMYMQVLIDGYKVVLEANATPYNYHAAIDGKFLLCEQPA